VVQHSTGMVPIVGTYTADTTNDTIYMRGSQTGALTTGTIRYANVDIWWGNDGYGFKENEVLATGYTSQGFPWNKFPHTNVCLLSGGAVMSKLIILFIVYLGLAGCGHSSPSDEPIITNGSFPTPTVPISEIEPFKASISVPSQLKSEEEFTIESTLQNITDNSFTIQYAALVFYISIKDSNGKQVNTFAMGERGTIGTIKGKGTISEKYTYKLDKPGIYEVSATAKFKIGDGENSKDYGLLTKATFEVIQ
jgi:hypothetical protein